jgi:hypothetical protein
VDFKDVSRKICRIIRWLPQAGSGGNQGTRSGRRETMLQSPSQHAHC